MIGVTVKLFFKVILTHGSIAYRSSLLFWKNIFRSTFITSIDREQMNFTNWYK